MKSTRSTVCVLVCGLGLILPAGLRAESRTFTSSDGKTMEAELISATDSTAKVKRADGRVIAFSLSRLSAEDQDYVRNWAKENVNFNIHIDARKKIKDSDTAKAGNTKTRTKSYVYNVSLNNRSMEDAEELNVVYRVFTGSGFKEGSHDVSFLMEKGTEEFETVGISRTSSKTVTVAASGGG